MSDRDKIAALMEAVTIHDLDFVEDRFVQVLSEVDMPRHKTLIDVMICHGDASYYDLAHLCHWLRTDMIPQACKHILEVSPYAHIARAALVGTDWDYVQPHLKEWEPEEADNAEYLATLGRRYSSLKQWDAAERCLSRAVELSPNVSLLQYLAQVYQGRGDLERWEATLKRALEAEDPGLGRMNVEVDLAYYYIRNKQYDKALPYAESAANTWANRGMQCAAVCREQMGDWDQAELWTRRYSERYPETNWIAWFSWCRRTDHGDVAAAREAGMRYIDSMNEHSSDEVREWAGLFHIIDGAPREALKFLVPIQEHNPNAVRGLMIASLADGIGDATLRDRTLNGLESKPQGSDLKLGSIINVVRSGLSQPGGTIDQAAVRSTLNEIHESRRYLVAVFVARMLYAHGSPDRAKTIVRVSKDQLGNIGWAQATAAVTLREWEKQHPTDAPGETKK